ncbi:MAG TPA: prolipoprotein diacylglyceryl transferase family protein [Candidatus Sulfotelmatobacter sp.]|nr:prolipoprotein diacylglyceryl transferase family protein [Candidatus Sulfotelmatobacter sp.]
MTLQKILYGSLFALLLPALLVLWASAAATQIKLPALGNAALGVAIAVFGLGLMLLAMLELWRFGGGLPMNAFPPPTLVSRGTYRYFPHPIYTGFVAVCLGVSMAARSASGIWLITPTVILGCVALVLGYEHPDLMRRFGRALPVLPANDDTPPSQLERIRFLLHVVVPWIALFEITSRLPLPGTKFGFPFEDRLPILSWTALFYESTYLAVALAPWCARTRKELRQLTISAWFATLVVFPFYWLVPSVAPRRPLHDGGFLSGWLSSSMTSLLRLERTTYPPVAAFPSFHVLWAVLVARLFRPRWIGWTYVTAVAVTCITTGMHYMADVVAAFIIAPLFLEPQRAWEVLRRTTERLANSWREWRIGSLRIINHSVYAGAAGLIQLTVVLSAVGPAVQWKALVTAVAGLIGAGAWAQWVEGSSRLRRPFGFYGGLIGVGVACLCFADRWTLLAAHCLGAPWMQAIGRLRCLVNGCCHGRPACDATGIRVLHPQSRVTRLAELTGVPIHATQLYSILCNAALGLLLLRLWISGSPLTVICGLYGIGNGLSRFAEEAYRGEPQTPTVCGLRLYQWLAIGTVIGGAVLTTFHSVPSPPLHFSLGGFALAAGFAFIAGAAMGVDLPESNRPLARLT